MKMVEWLRSLRYVVANHAKDNSRLVSRMNSLERVLRERTDIAVDVGSPVRDSLGSHVIVIGRYNRQHYVQTYTIKEEDLVHLVHQLREMERYGRVMTIDAPPVVRAAFRNAMEE
jgi:hypothetical protein